MEDFTLTSIEARFKKWDYCTPIHYRGSTFQPRQDNDLMNYKQKNIGSDQGHECQENTRLVLIIRSKNKT
jgi:hypothetical protein